MKHPKGRGKRQADDLCAMPGPTPLETAFLRKSTEGQGTGKQTSTGSHYSSSLSSNVLPPLETGPNTLLGTHLTVQTGPQSSTSIRGGSTSQPGFNGSSLDRDSPEDAPLSNSIPQPSQATPYGENPSYQDVTPKGNPSSNGQSSPSQQLLSKPNYSQLAQP
jgi:hypothetical protein